MLQIQRKKESWVQNRRITVAAENTYQKLDEDAAYAKAHEDTKMLTFDLEKSLPTPILSTGVMYYKRQLWTYNQGIHDCSTGKATMYMWNESVASQDHRKLAHVYSNTWRKWNQLQPSWLHIVMHVEVRIAISTWPVCGCTLLQAVTTHSLLLTTSSWSRGIHFYQTTTTWACQKKNEHIFVPEDWERVVAHAHCKIPSMSKKCTREFSVTRATYDSNS